MELPGKPFSISLGFVRVSIINVFLKCLLLFEFASGCNFVYGFSEKIL